VHEARCAPHRHFSVTVRFVTIRPKNQPTQSHHTDSSTHAAARLQNDFGLKNIGSRGIKLAARQVSNSSCELMCLPIGELASPSSQVITQPMKRKTSAQTVWKRECRTAERVFRISLTSPGVNDLRLYSGDWRRETKPKPEGRNQRRGHPQNPVPQSSAYIRVSPCSSVVRSLQIFLSKFLRSLRSQKKSLDLLTFICLTEQRWQ
jgi:hypothetical protein